MTGELGVKVGGSLGAMDAEAVVLALRALLQLLGPPPAADEDTEPPVWALTTLRASSAILAVRPGGVVSAESLERIDTVADGLRRLDDVAGEPPGWSPQDISNLLAFQKVIGMAGVTGVSFFFGDETPDVSLSERVLDNARSSLATASTSIGSVRGHLNRYNNSPGHREVGLREEGTGRPVTITFPAELQQDMLAAMERDVLIVGQVRRNSDGRKTSVRAEGIEVLHFAPPEPVEHLFGILGDWTDGLDSVEFIERQRRA